MSKPKPKDVQKVVPPTSPTAPEAPADFPRTVRATRVGFYGHSLRQKGDVFQIQNAKEKGSWMEFVETDTQTSAVSADAEPDTLSKMPESDDVL